MPLSKGVTIVFSSLGTSKKWTGNTSITLFISQNTHIQWHVSKNFKVNQQLLVFWWPPDWLVSCVELQELKFGGFSHLKFQNFPGEDPGPPVHFAVPMQNTFRRPWVINIGDSQLLSLTGRVRPEPVKNSLFSGTRCSYLHAAFFHVLKRHIRDNLAKNLQKNDLLSSSWKLLPSYWTLILRPRVLRRPI